MFVMPVKIIQSLSKKKKGNAFTSLVTKDRYIKKKRSQKEN